jgi:hypothetical protein
MLFNTHLTIIKLRTGPNLLLFATKIQKKVNNMWTINV